MSEVTQQPKGILIRLPDVKQEICIKPDWIAERDAIVTEAAAIETVTDNESYEAGSVLLGKITKVSNGLETIRKQLAKPFQEAAKKIKRASDQAREPLESEKLRLKKALGDYSAEQECIRWEEQARIEEEQRREIERQAAERAAEEDLGITDENEEFEPDISAAPPVPQAPRSSATKVIKRLTWTIRAEDEVPKGLMSVDPKKVNEHMRDNKDIIMQMCEHNQGADVVPGLVFEIKTEVSAR